MVARSLSSLASPSVGDQFQVRRAVSLANRSSMVRGLVVLPGVPRLPPGAFCHALRDVSQEAPGGSPGTPRACCQPCHHHAQHITVEQRRLSGPIKALSVSDGILRTARRSLHNHVPPRTTHPPLPPLVRRCAYERCAVGRAGLQRIAGVRGRVTRFAWPVRAQVFSCRRVAGARYVRPRSGAACPQRKEHAAC